MLTTLIALIERHPIAATAAFTWIGKYGLTALVGALPAPGKDSGGLYRFVFTFANGLAGNIQRARSSKVEDSPNWQDAVDKHTAEHPEACA